MSILLVYISYYYYCYYVLINNVCMYVGTGITDTMKMMNDFKPIYATNNINTNKQNQSSTGRDEEQELLHTLQHMKTSIEQLDLHQTDKNMNKSFNNTSNNNNNAIPQMVLSTDKFI